MPITTQPELPRLRFARYHLPTLGVETAKGALDVTEDELFQLLDRGAFWAWHVESPGADRELIRLLTFSVQAVTRDRARQLLDNEFELCTAVPATADDACALVLNACRDKTKPFLSGKEIRRVLNFGRTHLIDLVASGALKLLPGSTYRPGPNGFPLVPRIAFEQFLQERIKL